MLVCVDWWVGVRVVKKWVLRLCVVSRRKGAGREFQLGAKLAHLAEALREMRNCSAQWRESSSLLPTRTFFPNEGKIMKMIVIFLMLVHLRYIYVFS